ncbi:GNAT family N-acetyltransferase [Pseudalkalibacillus hwajinpoensis]|uniref:GNAT family N-acetyltransferase n=1 Tax=Guptibacillus hwajinpoensis TaxID=208199 RepID=UPI001CD28C38|nr:GNAT family N-acetyltransferase [Pseudalkalibacillus hwajinpoensis]MCA0993383.1 GNAT family N-acetyltransferase [Pseudalkalibacillus hwajinpoensis]
MKTITDPTIKLKPSLNQIDYYEILRLKDRCLDEEEDLTLKLELDYKLNHSRNESTGQHKLNEFLFYDDYTLIGYMGICQFSSEALEVNGMVHPDYRRMGVFKRLFSFVHDEWNKRESKQMLLLSDHNSRSGIEFSKSMGAHYENSEYEMHLVGEASEAIEMTNLHFRKALKQDAKEIARQNAIYFHMNSDEEFPEETSIGGMDVFLAEWNQSVVGKVHIELQNGVGGIYGLGVLPEYRRQGFGREILMKAVKELRDKQAQQILLQVAVKNKNALKLYRSCGFKVTSTMDYFKLTKK